MFENDMEVKTCGGGYRPKTIADGGDMPLDGGYKPKPGSSPDVVQPRDSGNY